MAIPHDFYHIAYFRIPPDVLYIPHAYLQLLLRNPPKKAPAENLRHSRMPEPHTQRFTVPSLFMLSLNKVLPFST